MPKKAGPQRHYWAQALSTLIAQVNVDIDDSIESTCDKIYKAIGKKPEDKYEAVLCANILMRNTTLSAKFMTPFLTECLKPTKNSALLERGLIVLLTIMRGTYCSRTTQFWEWGNYNSLARPGVVISHINEPRQAQSAKDSYTNLFLSNLNTPEAIAQYPMIVTNILINLAARDMTYFCQTTYPQMLQKHGANCIKITISLLRVLADPVCHFVEYAQSSPFHQDIRVDNVLGSFVDQAKVELVKIAQAKKVTTRAKEALIFALNDRTSFPRFVLPINCYAMSANLTIRVRAATTDVAQILDEWSVSFSPAKSKVSASYTSIDSATDEEYRYIRLLLIFPMIIKEEDFKDHKIFDVLVDQINSSSRLVAIYAVRVLNQIYTANQEARIHILMTILQHMQQTTNKNSAFTLIRLMILLLELKMMLGDQNRVVEMANEAECTIITLFAIPCAEVRDSLISLIAHIHALIDTPDQPARSLFNILTRSKDEMSLAVQYRVCIEANNGCIASLALPDTLIPIHTIFTSRFEDLSRYALKEFASRVAVTFDHAKLAHLQDILLKLANDNATERINDHFINLMIILMNVTLRLFSQDELSAIHGKQTAFYEDPPTVSIANAEIRARITANTEQTAKIIINLLIKRTQDKAIPTILRFIGWRVAGEVIPTVISLELQSAVLLLKELVLDPNFSLVLSANNAARMGILNLMDKLAKFLVNTKVTGLRRISTFGDLKGNMSLAIAYCVIYEHFIIAIYQKRLIPNEGAIIVPVPDPWLVDQWSVEKRQEAVLMLMNWTHLSDDEDADMFNLGTLATYTICDFIRLGPLFGGQLVQMDLEMENLFLRLQQTHEDSTILHDILQNNYEMMIDAFMSHMYSAPPEIAPLFFMAVAQQFYDQSKESLSYSFSLQYSQALRSSRRSLGSSQVRSFAQARQTSNFSLGMTPLTELDVQRNRDLVAKSGFLLPCAFVCLLHESYTVRSAAYRFLVRVGPVLHTIAYPKADRQTADFLKAIQEYATSFYSSVVTITRKIMMKIVSLFAENLPCLAELIIHDVLTNMSVSARGSFLTPSNRALLLDVIAAFVRQITLHPHVSTIQREFAILTPTQLMKMVLDALPALEPTANPKYLEIWSSLMANKENIDLIMSFLFKASQEEHMVISVKMIFVHLATKLPEVLDQLVEKLTISSWYYQTVFSHMNEITPPPAELSPMMETVVLTITEIAQTDFDILLAHVHLILNYAIIHYDRENTLFAELLLVVVNKITNGAESLVRPLIPPVSLVWDKEKSQAAALDTYLAAMQPRGSRNMVFLADYLANLTAKLRISNPALLDAWGKECQQWACSCGDLHVAARAAFVFSSLLTPWDTSTVEGIALAITTVGMCPFTPIVSKYLVNMFMVVDHAITCGKEGLSSLFGVVEPFLIAPDQKEICLSGLGLVTQFALRLQPTKHDLKKLLTRLARLFAVVRPHTTLLAAIMTICLREAEGTGNLGVLAFIVLLPSLYIAFAAFHNVQPYSSQASDKQIIPYLQTLMLLRNVKFLPESIRNALFNDFSEMKPHEFLINMCSPLQEEKPSAVAKGSKLLQQMAEDADGILLSAIFEVTVCFIDCGCTSSVFAQIAKIATGKRTFQAVKCVQSAVAAGLMQIPVPKPETNFGWEKVNKRMKSRRANYPRTCPPDSLYPFVPLEPAIWQSDAIVHERTECKCPALQQYVEHDHEMNDLLEQPIDFPSAELEIVTVANSYLAYRDYMHQ